MKKGKTRTGFEFAFEEKVLKEWKTVDAISECDDGNAIIKFKALKRLAIQLIGESGLDKLLAHVAKVNDGDCSVGNVTAEILDILKVDSIKN